jgi:hypothetical protein
MKAAKQQSLRNKHSEGRTEFLPSTALPLASGKLRDINLRSTFEIETSADSQWLCGVLCQTITFKA